MRDHGHDVRGHWEGRAAEWVAWVRADDHDAFWSYRDGLRAFLPSPGSATLDLGCGEGRISRELVSLGHSVTAADVSAPLLRAAREAGSASYYVQVDAAELPFAVGTFDRVVAYNMLMDVADMPAVVREISRVLRPDGVATISILHPFGESGRFVGQGPEAPFVIEGAYFGQRHYEHSHARDGLEMHFAGWTRPLQDYTVALSDAGLVITHLAEPTPRATDRRRADRWSRLPLFCWMNVAHRR